MWPLMGQSLLRHTTHRVRARMFAFLTRCWPAMTCCISRTQRQAPSTLRLNLSCYSVPLILPCRELLPKIHCCLHRIVPVLVRLIKSGGLTNSMTRATLLAASRISSPDQRHRRYTWLVTNIVPNHNLFSHLFFSPFIPGFP